MPRARRPRPGDPNLAIVLIGVCVPAVEQEALVAEFARQRGLVVKATFRGVVIDTMPAGGLVQLLVCAEQLGVGTILSATRRVASDAAEAALLERLAVRSGARWISAAEDATWSSEEVRSVSRVLQMHESLIFTPKIHLARDEGRSPQRGGPPPWGMRRSAGSGGWEPDPAEQEALGEVLRRRASGMSLDQIARYLNSLKLPNRRTVYRNTVRNILNRLEPEHADV